MILLHALSAFVTVLVVVCFLIMPAIVVIAYTAFMLAVLV